MDDRDPDIARALEHATQIMVALRWAAQAGRCLPRLLDDASSATIRELQQLAAELAEDERTTAVRRHHARK